MKVFLIITFSLASVLGQSQNLDSAAYGKWIESYISQLSSDTGIYLPKTKFVDDKGKIRSLDEFKGKVVYIDVWEKREADNM